MIKFILSYMFILFGLLSYEAGKHTDSGSVYENCSTELFYSKDSSSKDKTTLITFYGDSRMDNVDAGGIYGTSSMDQILNVGNTDSSANFTFENIQNFGYAGWTTGQIAEHLNKCLPKIDSVFNFSTAISASERTYKVGKRFVYHAGGNNMLFAGVTSGHAKLNLSQSDKGRAALPMALAWIFVLHHHLAVTDSSAIIDRLREYASSKSRFARYKDVLFVGGYKTYPTFVGSIDASPSGLFTPAEKPNQWNLYLDANSYISAGIFTLNNDYRNIAADKGVHLCDF